MPLAQVSFKTNPQLKTKALAKAEREGITLKALLTMAMKAYVEEEIEVGMRRKGETPSPYLLRAMKEAEDDWSKGRVSPAFDHAEDAVQWLRNKRRPYAGKV
jgi:hypothetical protein